MREPVVSDLLTLLETEAKALLAGDYAVLDDLASRKIELFDNLQRNPPASEDLRRIAQQVSRNHALLAGAIRGVSAARARLAALRAVREGLQVYDRSGRFAAAPVTRPDLIKKA